ncbi:hypothetical protein [Chitinophaga sp. CF118]|uniref:hypothetical protein n=1 Tax=Chitinophaga sp. CF118 TaxID=1884367 RepID=UPI000B7EAFC1|nr:hypothetical protein [Chitinophaga sp. CF118]
MRSYFCFNRILAGVIALLLIATIFFACTKNGSDAAPSNANDNLSISAAGNEATVSSVYNDLFSVVAEVSINMGLSETGRIAKNNQSGKLGYCYTPTADDMTIDHWPKVLTVDFGTGCPDVSGRSRAGILKLTYTGYFRYPGATVTVEPITYTVNGVKLTGTDLITNLSTNDVYKYSAEVKGGTIQIDTITISYGSKFTITQTAGAGTTEGDDATSDDVYTFTGSDALTYPDGNIATATISDSAALVRKFDCPYIGKGKVALTFKSVITTIDYGNGVCDDSVLVSIGDKVKNVALPK